MKKNAMSQMWWIIGTAFLVLVVVLLILLFFRSGSTKAFDTIDNQIGGLGDCDGDKAADAFDDCKCNPSIQDLSEGQTDTDCGVCTIEACK
ncbi:hypothetical protein COV17_01415 [Candidatus Woesearchaeota archaeon CG10_big_fil_rev_8_21_14_0_10_36_11]|nr:MAG: hypothetical protein COV17_01415 [Candidatus Woesearchaeota archaeon CG10_big_fil_rev_8_21_14_0_10_36_11]